MGISLATMQIEHTPIFSVWSVSCGEQVTIVDLNYLALYAKRASGLQMLQGGSRHRNALNRNPNLSTLEQFDSTFQFFERQRRVSCQSASTFLTGVLERRRWHPTRRSST